MSYFVKVVDGTWNFSPLGYVVLGLIVLLLLFTISFSNHKQRNNKLLSSKQLVFAGVCIALAVVTSMIKFYHLPAGGSTTLFSMLFVVLVGYFYGIKIGITSAIAYGLLQLLIDPYVIGVPQLFCDYILAFGSLGLSGIFTNKKHGLLKGYLLGVGMRYVFAVLSGFIFFAESRTGLSALIFSITYNASYILPEVIITIVILFIPAVSGAFTMVKRTALE
mgnify:CR=1 FL=1